MSVIAPADSRFVRIPNRCSSSASVALRPFSPPFAAEYDEKPGVPLMPAPDVTLRMEPQPARFMPGTNSRMYQNGAVRFDEQRSRPTPRRSRGDRGARRDRRVVDQHVDRAERLLRAVGTTRGSPPATTGRRRCRACALRSPSPRARRHPAGDRSPRPPRPRPRTVPPPCARCRAWSRSTSATCPSSAPITSPSMPGRGLPLVGQAGVDGKDHPG